MNLRHSKAEPTLKSFGGLRFIFESPRERIANVRSFNDRAPLRKINSRDDRINSGSRIIREEENLLKNDEEEREERRRLSARISERNER